MLDPVDAFLFSQINAGNVISLALDKGYGSFGAGANLDYIFEELFAKPFGGGFPPYRAESQIASRKRLQEVSARDHYPMLEILHRMDADFIRKCVNVRQDLDYVKQAPASAEKDFVLSLMA